jgi:hypothetical protein
VSTPDSEDQPNKDAARHKAGLQAALETWREGCPTEPMEHDYFLRLMEKAISAYHAQTGVVPPYPIDPNKWYTR